MKPNKKFRKPTLAEDLYFLNEYRRKKVNKPKQETSDKRPEKIEPPALQAG